MLNENIIAHLARRKVVSDTFRRLPPEKKELIYNEAIALFGRYGYDGLPVDRFCKEAGISKGSFFQYFPSKMHLLEFTILLFDDRLEKWVAHIRKTETGAHARDRLVHLYTSAVDSVRLHPSEQMFYLFVTHAVAHAGVTIEGIDLERHLHHHVRQIVDRGMQTGEIRGDLQTDFVTNLVAVTLAAFVRREFSDKQSGVGATGEQLIATLFDGVQG